MTSEDCHGGKLIPSLSSSKTCVGLVADQKEIPWTSPRKILFFDANTAFVSAMGNWTKNQGQIWKLNFKNSRLVSYELVFNKTDRTHGLAIGPDNFIYFADATRILKFDPTNTKKNFDVLLDRLPDSYKNKKNVISESSHPLKEFLFLKNGDLVINIGAPSNDCSEEYKEFKACHQRDEQAELRLYTYDPTFKSYSKNFKVLARGLRNSMGLLYNSNLNLIYQAENAADLLGTPDELNIIDLNSYPTIQDFGWPFCFGVAKNYLGYDNFKNFCSQKSISPYFMMPAHAAPLELKYYRGKMFPEFQNAILTSWHGHRNSGSKIAIYKTDQDLHPLSSYSLNNEQPEMLIPKDWNAKLGSHPKGRPVGLDFDSLGAIYILDDKNNTLMVVAKRHSDSTTVDPKNMIDQQDVAFSKESLKAWNTIFESTFKNSVCLQCHTDVFGSNRADQVLNEILNSGWINPNSNVLSDQTLWKALTGFEGTKRMPPTPLNSISKTQLTNLENWILSF